MIADDRHPKQHTDIVSIKIRESGELPNIFKLRNLGDQDNLYKTISFTKPRPHFLLHVLLFADDPPGVST